MSFNKFDFISSYATFEQLPNTTFPEVVFELLVIKRPDFLKVKQKSSTSNDDVQF